MTRSWNFLTMLSCNFKYGILFHVNNPVNRRFDLGMKSFGLRFFFFNPPRIKVRSEERE